MKNENLTALRAAKKVAREVYAWPGGYPLFVVTHDGAALCPACVKKEWRNIVSAALDDARSSGWLPAAHDINWEDGDLFCDNCSQRIPSAYAEPEDSAEDAAS